MKIAFVFPGQGSQSVGMLNAWQDHPVVMDTLERASQVLEQDLVRLIAQGPADQLNLTVNTQPVMLAADMAIYAAWQAEKGPVPHVVAGHSLGEYAALTAAKALAFEDALRLVRIRAEAMQTAVPVDMGAMAAIVGVEEDTVRALCAEHCTSHERVEAVNFNAPTQIVIAGHKGAVKQVCEAVRQLVPTREEKIRVLPLRVSAPFHSSLMEGVAPTLRQALKEVTVSTPCIAVINNVDVAMPTEPAAICDALVRQAWHPVRWVETLHAMQVQGVTHVIECGPGKILTGLVKKNVEASESTLTYLALSDPASLKAALEIVGHC